MGACHSKKKYKDELRINELKIFEEKNNLINMGLGEIEMNHGSFCKLYNKMLEPQKLTMISMQNTGTNTLDHYYKSNNTTNMASLKNSIKKIQSELKILHSQLPVELSNSIFIRQASSNQNFMKTLISGSDNTPYANGLFLYDIFLPENYPNQCPKMQLITTGHNQIRFNPNLYSSGYVCLSLLGTWRGDSVESWNPEKSNLLQVLLSIQSLVMSEGVYYNEPSHENDYKTTIGKQRNVGYSNIVRYATVKYAINEMIQSPPKGFEDVVKLHFTIKSNFIKQTLDQWVENANKDNSNASYDGLVNSHNYNLATEFQKNSSTYYNKLKAEVDIAKNLITNLVQSEIQNDSHIFLRKVLEKNEKQDQEINNKNAEKGNQESEKDDQKDNDKQENKEQQENNENKLKISQNNDEKLQNQLESIIEEEQEEKIKIAEFQKSIEEQISV